MRFDRTLLAGLTLGSAATLAAQSPAPAPDDTLLEEIHERVVELQQGQADLRAQVSTLTTHLLAGDSAGPLLFSEDVEPDSEERRAMTWTLRGEAGNNLVLVGRDDATNAYHGDTPVGESLPLLAFRPGGLSQPEALFDEVYGGDWSGGTVMLTSPVAGTEITSLERANEIIREELGEGWRMADFHLGGGWRFWARGHVPAEQRFWVHIRDQDANPWDTDQERYQPFTDLLMLDGC